jgi:cell division protein FtsQ
MMRIRLPRLTMRKCEAAARSRMAGALTRASALTLLGLTIGHGLVAGGHLDYEGSPFTRLPGQAASLVGFAAGDIRISGLKHHEPEAVLAALAVKPGGSLIGFDAVEARQRLEGLDWVSSANVQRLFPNQLEIELVERKPFAVWQTGGQYFVIDHTGAAMRSLPAGRLPDLPLVTGEGAAQAAEELVNQLEATPDLSSQLYAAARVGKRRWNLYLETGVVVLLPETDIGGALARLQEVQTRQAILSKAIKTVDLRFDDRMIIGLADGAGGQDVLTGSLPAKKSR